MMVPFTKASACGNDFLIIDGRHADGRHAPYAVHEFSRRICDRHNGVGADGVEWIFPGEGSGAHARVRLINADGSEAEISGNGTRCVAAFLASQGRTGKISILTGAGIKQCTLISQVGKTYEFEMEMGQPEVGEPFSLAMSFGPVQGTPVSMGNPHYVIFVDEFSPAWQQLGAEIGRQPHFKDGVNVEFVRIQGPSAIEVRFFERGVGETQSSGTGSSASAAAAIAAGRVSSPVSVHAPGGTQTVRWQAGESLFLQGTAQLICRGEFFA